MPKYVGAWTHGPAWTDDRVERLTRLWREGLSASVIATRLGGITRNSVIGKLHRMGLTKDGRPAARKRKGNTLRMGRPHNPTLTSYALPPREQTDVATVSWDRMDEKRTCRWIPGDPQKTDQNQPLFCGGERVSGLPYCTAHTMRAFSPIELRKRGIVVTQAPVLDFVKEDA